MNIFEPFERIYLINLPERSDRRRDALAELAAAGIGAADPRLRIFAARRFADAGQFPSIGARGCHISHLEVIREAMRDKLANVLILEDDIALTPGAANPPAAMLARLQQGGWDFCYPGHVETLPAGNGAAPRWIETRLPLMCSHFYGLHQRVLPRLAGYLEACMQRPPGHPDGGPMHIDGAYSMFRAREAHVVTLLSVPSFGGQRSSRSDIYPNRWFDRTPLFREAASLLRRARNEAGKLRGRAANSRDA
jgi:hypothetical protein